MKQTFYSLFIGAIFTIICLQVNAQHDYDTINVMSYNVLNYGFDSSSECPALITANKHGWLTTVLEYTNPDILGLEKMDASPASFTSDTIIDRVLNSYCNGCWGHTPYTNNSGYSKENMLYYKASKFGWVNTTTIYSADSNISDINLHTLFYKSPSLASTHDTIFLHIILVHLESGSGSAAERAAEMTGAMSWLNTHVTAPGNYIFMGDFNTQSSSESCYQQMVNSANANTLFFDAENQPGDWDSHPSDFANYLTQSTRTTDPGDCGAVGGMDDWFDHLLCTNPIMEGTGLITYVPNSFYVIGQDGEHVNKAINASPTNTSVPANVLNALYYMSEHLPITMRLAIDSARNPTAGLNVVTPEPFSQWNYSSLVYDKISIKAIDPAAYNSQLQYFARVYDLTGRLLTEAPLNNTGENDLQVSNLADGTYLLVIVQRNQMVMSGKFVKMSR